MIYLSTPVPSQAHTAQCELRNNEFGRYIKIPLPNDPIRASLNHLRVYVNKNLSLYRVYYVKECIEASCFDQKL